MKQKIREVLEDFAEIRMVASSLAYSSLLSLIPFLIIVFAGFQSIGGLDDLYPKVEAILFSYLKEATGSTVTRFIRDTLANVDVRTLGISGAIFLVWTSLGLIRNIDFAFNRIWKIKINTPAHRRLWMHWLILIAVPIGLALFIGTKTVFFFSDRARSFETQFLFSMFIWGSLTGLYKVIPDTKVKFFAASISSLVSCLALLGVQKSFFWISIKVFRQNSIYGSLASFPIFLVWLLVVWYVLLLGVAFCKWLDNVDAGRVCLKFLQKRFKRS